MTESLQNPLQKPVQTFGDYLRHHNLTLTRQREDILATFLGAGQHISAEDLAAQVRAVNPRVGLSTVYRTLKLLVECELAEEHHFAGDVTLYEPLQRHHEHMICLTCSQIFEFEDEELEELKARIAERHGFKMVRHTLHLYGVCSACQGQGSEHVESVVRAR